MTRRPTDPCQRERGARPPQKLLDDLKAKSGKDFDQSYDQAQVKDHKDAVALFEAYAKSGDDPELKNWAAKTLPHLKEHLSMAEKLK